MEVVTQLLPNILEAIFGVELVSTIKLALQLSHLLEFAKNILPDLFDLNLLFCLSPHY